jgi:hypothetical protein
MIIYILHDYPFRARIIVFGRHPASHLRLPSAEHRILVIALFIIDYIALKCYSGPMPRVCEGRDGLLSVAEPSPGNGDGLGRCKKRPKRTIGSQADLASAETAPYYVGPCGFGTIELNAHSSGRPPAFGDSYLK